jgi:hypothetical protein
MRDRPKNPHKTVAGIQPEVLQGIYTAEHRPTHDQKWAELGAAEAPLARVALARAEEIRAEEMDPGEAYLQGVADFRAAHVRQGLIKEIADFDPATIIAAKQ